MLKYAFFGLVISVGALRAQSSIGLQSIETTGMVGIAVGQTAQFNLLNPGVQAPALGVMCTAIVSFVDNIGGVLKSATLTVIPGQSQSLSLKSDVDLNLTAGVRREIRAAIATPATPSASAASLAACKLVPTLEIIDTASGRTLVTLGHVTPIPSILTPATQRN